MSLWSSAGRRRKDVTTVTILSGARGSTARVSCFPCASFNPLLIARSVSVYVPQEMLQEREISLLCQEDVLTLPVQVETEDLEHSCPGEPYEKQRTSTLIKSIRKAVTRSASIIGFVFIVN